MLLQHPDALGIKNKRTTRRDRHVMIFPKSGIQMRHFVSLIAAVNFIVKTRQVH